MPHLTLSSSIFLLAILTASTLAESQPKPNNCPTITRSLPTPSCPLPTPLCPTPDCVVLSRVPLPCSCPTVLPTKTVYTACTTGCHGACSTAYEATPDCSSSPKSYPPTTISTVTTTPTKPTTTTVDTSIHTITQPTQCQTITHTDGPGCPTFSCASIPPACTVTSTVVNPCGLGCTGIADVTSCASKCRTACSTSFEKLYLPCPTSLTSSSVPTTAGDFTTTRGISTILTVPVY